MKHLVCHRYGTRRLKHGKVYRGEILEASAPEPSSEVFRQRIFNAIEPHIDHGH